MTQFVNLTKKILEVETTVKGTISTYLLISGENLRTLRIGVFWIHC